MGGPLADEIRLSLTEEVAERVVIGFRVLLSFLLSSGKEHAVHLSSLLVIDLFSLVKASFPGAKSELKLKG